MIVDQQPDIVTYAVELLRKIAQNESTDLKITSQGTALMVLRALR